MNSFVSSFRLMFYNLRCSRKFKSKQHVVVRLEKRQIRHSNSYIEVVIRYLLWNPKAQVSFTTTQREMFFRGSKSKSKQLSDARVSAAPQSYTKIFET